MRKTKFSVIDTRKQFRSKVLEWDFYKDISDEKLDSSNHLVSSRFHSFGDYIKTFEPLFFEELKAQLFRCRTMGDHGCTEKFTLSYRGAINPATKEIEMSFDSSSSEGKYSSSDLCLIQFGSVSGGVNTESAVHTLAYIQSSRSVIINNVEKIRLNVIVSLKEVHSGNEDGPRNHRIHLVAAVIKSGVKDEASRGVDQKFEASTNENIQTGEWFVTYLTRLSTAEREYHALHSFAESKFLDEILCGVATKKKDQNEDDVPERKSKKEQIRESMIQDTEMRGITDAKENSQSLSHLNRHQTDALNAVVQSSGVTLIQGPPGTGKTSTIVSIITSLLYNANEGERYVSAQLKERYFMNCPRKVPDSDDESELSTNSDNGVMSEGSDNSTSPTITNGVHICQASQVRCRGLVYNKQNANEYARWKSPWLFPGYQCWQDVSPIDPFRKQASSIDEAFPQEPIIEVDLAEARSLCSGKILVCAPSNAAVDEICRRLISHVNDNSDRLLLVPEVIRMGPNVGDSLISYSLKSKIEVEMERQKKISWNSARKRVMDRCSVVFCTLSVSGSADLTDYLMSFDNVIIDECTQGVELSALIPLRFDASRLVLVGDPEQLPPTVLSSNAKDNGYATSLFERLRSAGHEVHVLRVQYRMHPLISSFSNSQFYDNLVVDAPDILELVSTNRWSCFPIFSRICFFDIRGQNVEEERLKSLYNTKEAQFVSSLVDTLMRAFPEENWRETLGIISPYVSQVKLIRGILSSEAFSSKTRVPAHPIESRETAMDVDLKSEPFCFASVSGEEEPETSMVNGRDFSDPQSSEIQITTEEEVGPTNKIPPLDVNTVDSFQGREKRVIIFSCVRSNEKGGIGFLSDARRMNVGITRARENLWIIGNTKSLSQDDTWRSLIEFCRQNRTLFSVEEGDELNFIGRSFSRS